MLEAASRFVLGPSVRADLPKRVQDDIAKRQNEAERLIGWTQLLLVSLMGLLWFASPAPLPSVKFEPVPWVLGIYGSFTLVRLIASYRTRMPFWLLTLSIIMDVALLMSLIWSFHLQYSQPPSFYLKAPTVFYVFIFIALRALRFEPRYILMTGLASMVGWLVLMAYVVLSDPNDRMITRDFIEYMTSNAILIGAEIDKLVAIGLVTIILSIATERARRSFIRAVDAGTAATELSRFVSPEVAARITRADKALQPGDGEQRTATVLFTDIEGFSSVSEKLAPAELANTLNDYFGHLSSIVTKHNGVITHFNGDAMLVTFNAVSSEPDHASSALKCAGEIVRSCKENRFGKGEVLRTRCGINTGEVLLGVVGSKDRMDFTVHGDNVTLAARLEQLNKDYGTYILIAASTKTHCKNQSIFRKIGTVTVRGRAAPTDVFTLNNL